jgi:hypothetical protein
MKIKKMAERVSEDRVHNLKPPVLPVDTYFRPFQVRYHIQAAAN